MARLGERADRDDAFRAVVEFVGLPAVSPQFLGQQMSVLGRLDERIVASFFFQLHSEFDLSSSAALV